MNFIDLVGAFSGIASGVAGISEAKRLKRASAADDAMRPYRASYAAQLAALAKDPSSIVNDPGYKFALQQGEQTLQRTAAKQGQLGGGTMMQELQGYSQKFAGDYLNKREDQLSTLAGVNLPPTALRGQLEANKSLTSALQSFGGGLSYLAKGV